MGSGCHVFLAPDRVLVALTDVGPVHIAVVVDQVAVPRAASAAVTACPEVSYASEILVLTVEGIACLQGAKAVASRIFAQAVGEVAAEPADFGHRVAVSTSIEAVWVVVCQNAA